MNDFISFLQNLLGEYHPVMDNTGLIPSGFAGVDWSYLVRAAVFLLVVYSLFRILGGLVCKM